MERLGMFFETKYGKIKGALRAPKKELGMFFETKYGKIQLPSHTQNTDVRDVL